jgi:hypothetical protein
MYVHYTPWIIDSSTGDVTADSYHFYKEDVEALVQLGVRLSYIYPRYSRAMAHLVFVLSKPKLNYLLTKLKLVHIPIDEFRPHSSGSLFYYYTATYTS